MTYSMGRNSLSGLATIHKDRVYEIVNLNRKGIKPDKLITEAQEKQAPKELYGGNSLNDDSITRFDDSVKSKPKKKRRKSSVRRRNKNIPDKSSPSKSTPDKGAPNRNNQNKNNPNNPNNNNKGSNRDAK